MEMVSTDKAEKYGILLLEFIRFGCFTFGGGWSIIAQMRQLYVEKKHVITDEELLDLTSVAKSLPGTMIANVAMLYGYRAGGLPGGFLSVFGMVFPPMVIRSLSASSIRLFEAAIGLWQPWRVCRPPESRGPLPPTWGP